MSLRTRTLALLCTAGLVLTTAPADSAVTPASRAADWQTSQLTDGTITNVSYGVTDWGLTVDTGIMLAASGAHPAALRTLKNQVRRHRLAYIGSDGEKYAGATAKLLFAARVWRADVRNFGGTNLRRRLLSLGAPKSAGFEWGRFRDVSNYGEYSNTFGQSYAVLGLARTGGVPQASVNYLLKQRCSNGRFRPVMTKGQTCDQGNSAGDTDSTALAVQALLAARASGANVPQGVIGGSSRWLANHQAANGAFSGSVQTKTLNTNSTGLAALALQATGRKKAASRAGAWVRRMQLTPTRAKYPRDIGAIAYDRPARDAAAAAGITTTSRDSFRRATPQAYFALKRVPFNRLTAR